MIGQKLGGKQIYFCSENNLKCNNVNPCCVLRFTKPEPYRSCLDAENSRVVIMYVSLT